VGVLPCITRKFKERRVASRDPWGGGVLSKSEKRGEKIKNTTEESVNYIFRIEHGRKKEDLHLICHLPLEKEERGGELTKRKKWEKEKKAVLHSPAWFPEETSQVPDLSKGGRGQRPRASWGKRLKVMLSRQKGY